MSQYYGLSIFNVVTKHVTHDCVMSEELFQVTSFWANKRVKSS